MGKKDIIISRITESIGKEVSKDLEPFLADVIFLDIKKIVSREYEFWLGLNQEENSRESFVSFVNERINAIVKTIDYVYKHKKDHGYKEISYDKCEKILCEYIGIRIPKCIKGWELVNWNG